MPQQPGQYQRIVDRALRMTRRRTEEPIRIAEICRAAGVSPRTLLRAFRAVHGATPYRYLCSLRLLDARRILSAATGEPPTVTEVATRFGFVELGRFAVAYRSAFGKSPSATLRRSSPRRPKSPGPAGDRSVADRHEFPGGKPAGRQADADRRRTQLHRDELPGLPEPHGSGRAIGRKGGLAGFSRIAR